MMADALDWFLNTNKTKLEILVKNRTTQKEFSYSDFAKKKENLPRPLLASALWDYVGDIVETAAPWDTITINGRLYVCHRLKEDKNENT